MRSKTNGIRLKNNGGDNIDDGSKTQLIVHRTMTAIHPSAAVDLDQRAPTHYRWWPSFRLLTASLLCMCFASVHMMNSNLGMAMVCMINSTEYLDDNSSSLLLDYSPQVQGYIFSAFNVGLLFMLLTGCFADKLNAKYMIVASVLLASIANVIIPLGASSSFMYVIGGRILIGIADALLQPSVNSLITRWFPTSERSYALGLATGGRQLGTLIILPTAGILCSHTEILGGWPAIFYISAFNGLIFVVIYMLFGADKPSKMRFMSEAETKFIAISNAAEEMNEKRMQRSVPWRQLLSSSAVWASVISVLCHEFPLMTMIMFLPSYLHDVHHYDSTENGVFSALPTACLWLSKIFSSYLNTWLQRKTYWRRTTICKVLNSCASIGLAVFLFASTFLDSSWASMAVVLLCCSMASAGLHTPGCQTALVSVAPAFSGTITGLTFFFVACSGIVNPLLTKTIVQNGTHTEWNSVFYISTGIALLPLVIFNIWGSADVQWWSKKSPPAPIMTIKLSSDINNSIDKVIVSPKKVLAADKSELTN